MTFTSEHASLAIAILGAALGLLSFLRAGKREDSEDLKTSILAVVRQERAAVLQEMFERERTRTRADVAEVVKLAEGIRHELDARIRELAKDVTQQGNTVAGLDRWSNDVRNDVNRMTNMASRLIARIKEDTNGL